MSSYNGVLGEEQTLLRPEGGEGREENLPSRGPAEDEAAWSLGTPSFVPPFLGRRNDITPHSQPSEAGAD